MRKGKHSVRRSYAKALTMALALVLAVGCIVGGTVAWLSDTTSEVKNTFTSADIDIELTETFNTDSNNDGTPDKWQAQIIPGYSYTKDPKVSVSNTSVDCYLFVKFEENNSPSTYLTYTSNLTAANGWTQGDGISIPANVWYREVLASDATREWKLLSNDKISVKETVTKGDMTNAAKAELVYTAYATQLYKDANTQFTATRAWENISA